ncbi:MAG: hypothetical protein UHO11_07165 [Treponema sp.]|nr:hypothetical protein [Treponema sp.]
MKFDVFCQFSSIYAKKILTKLNKKGAALCSAMPIRQPGTRVGGENVPGIIIIALHLRIL